LASRFAESWYKSEKRDREPLIDNPFLESAYVHAIESGSHD